MRDPVVERGQRAGLAAALHELPVHVEEAGRAGLLVQVVDVLGAEEETIRERGFKARESEMGGIGPGGGSHAAAHGVKVPDEARVAAPGVGRGDLFEAVVAPETSGIAKRGDPTFGAYTGPGKNENTIAGRYV